MVDSSVFHIIGADASASTKQADIAVIPLGSIEYHGPHAPIGTDSLIAQELGVRVAQRLPNAILYPLVAYTTCPVTTRTFSGTVSIDADVMSAYIEGILRSLFDQGLQGILALNAHDGNIQPIRRAAELVFFDYPDHFVLTVNWWQTVPTALVNSLNLFSNEGGHGHGGPLETSAAWAAQPPPGTVDTRRAKDIDVIDEPTLLTVLNPGKDPSDWQGYHGHVSESSAEKGKILLKIAEDKIVDLVNEWLNQR
jgi:creatinine amidohydrolase